MVTTVPEPILIVDDDMLFRRAFGRTLNGNGYRTVTAEGLDDALARLCEEPNLAMAVVDLHLANHTGLDVIRELRAARGDLRCVLLSAFCSTVVAVEAMRVGALDCIQKSSSLEWVAAELRGRPNEIPSVEVAVPTLAQVEWDHIQRVLHDSGGNISLTARKLGIMRQSLQRKIKRYAPVKPVK